MSYTDADREFEAEVLAALQKYSAAENDDGDVVTDWVMVFTRQMIDDDDYVRHANSYHSNFGGNPNAHSGMLGWVQAIIDGMMLDSVDDD